MRNKIFEIYKALRHFGVSAEEVEQIANGYKIWVNNQIEDIRRGYRIVYYYKGALYAMPFLIDEIKNRFVGIEIDGVVYFACQLYTSYYVVYETLSDMWCKFPLRVLPDFEEVGSIKMEIPTKDEIVSMFNCVNGKGRDIMHNGRHLYEEVSHLYTRWWAIMSYTDQKLTPVDAHGVPDTSYKAAIQPVAHLRKGIDFAGEINNYGVPDYKTLKVYKELTASAVH
jgi:hypothetical protein